MFSCSPFQRMILNADNRNNFLEDSCDLQIITELKQSLDTIEYNKPLDQTRLLEDLINESECEYYAHELDPLHEDSAIWLMTIRPVLVGKDEIIVGNLFTFDHDQDSTFIFQRRVKEYSQKENFETGKYVVFTYFMENDAPVSIKAGKRKQ